MKYCNKPEKAGAAGTTTVGEMSVVGYWIEVTNEENRETPETAERMRCVATANALPLTTFVIESDPMLDQAPKIHDTIEAGGKLRPWAVSANRGGLRYFINLDTGEALVVDRYREVRTMTSAEAATFNKELIEKLDATSYRVIADRLTSAIAKTHEVELQCILAGFASNMPGDFASL